MLNLVIVDDEARIRHGIEKVVEQSGRDVKIAGSFSNGMHAYNFIMERPAGAIDLVMTDIMMPVMDGLKLIGKLKPERPGMTFVIISGFDDFEYARQGLKYGVMDYLMKPLNFDEIIQILDRSDQTAAADPLPSIPSQTSVPDTAAVVTADTNAHRITEQVKAIINRQYSRDVSLQELADDVFITPFYLSKLFRRETGVTVTDYLIQVRIARAKQLLEYHPEMKVFEVSDRVGYTDAAYFNRLFKKVVGVTPKEYKDYQHKPQNAKPVQ